MRKTGKLPQLLAIASQLGFSIILPMVGGAFLGSYLDAKFQSSPKLTLSLIFLGLFIGAYNIYNIIKEFNK